MNFLEKLQKINAQKRIDKLAKKLKNKKVVIYGAGEFSTDIFSNYDLSKLNIVAIADKKFENNDEKFFSYKTVGPNDLSSLEFDVILIANINYKYFKGIIKDLLFSFNMKKRVKILPLIKFSIKRKINCFFGLIYKLFPSEYFVNRLTKCLAKIATICIFNKKEREEAIKNKKNSYKTQIYGYQILKTARSIGEGFFCGGYSSVSGNTILKDNVRMNGMRIMGGGKVTIGRYFHSGIECLIISQNHNYDKGDAIPYDTTYIYKDVEIGDFVWVGSRVMILPGTKIGEGAIIQGGSVVHGEIPPYAIAGGNPAKVFKYRDIEHFKTLKAEEKFY